MNVPNFFIVGAAKCGTTSLVEALSQHEEVFFSPVKEPYFYVSNPEITRSEYEGLFKAAGSEKVLGEASTGYLFDRLSPYLIKNDVPDAKILIVLRAPQHQMRSLWNHMRVHGNESLSLQAAIRDQPFRLTDDFRERCAGRNENYLYLPRALYADQVQRFFSVFPARQIKVVIFENLISSWDSETKRILDFLEVKSGQPLKAAKTNIASKSRFELVRSLTTRRYPLLKAVIPLTTRRAIRASLKNINKRPAVNVATANDLSALDASIRSALVDDVMRLQSLIEIDGLLELWGLNQVPAG